MSKQESYWFSHDSNAANNPKMVALKRKYGYEGYGRWWRLVERLRECADYRYDISVPFAWEVIGQDLDMSAADAESFVRECIDYYQLLETDGQYFWSSDLDDRMEYWEKRREVLRERGRKGGKARRKKDTDEDGDKQDASTTKQNASTSLSTSTVNLKPKEANETKQNQTKQNETTFIYIEEEDNDDNAVSEEGEEVNKEDVMEQQTNVFSALRDKALADDQRFVYAYVSTGKLSKEQLGKWLTAFNSWLEFTGEQVKEERDYRRHFAAWFRYRDIQREDPEQYNPASISTPKQQPPATKTVPLPASIPPDKPKGKFSKGSNRYDMHWLKNLRDEVRTMGG